MKTHSKINLDTAHDELTEKIARFLLFLPSLLPFFKTSWKRFEGYLRDKVDCVIWMNN